MQILYIILFYSIVPLIILRLIWRGFKAKEYWYRWSERFGFYNNTILKSQNCIWIHAVSVGEVHAAVPLIKLLLKNYPQQNILITNMTPTGSAQVKQIFAEQKRIINCYLPYDLPDAVNRFLNKTQPKLAIIMETELWSVLFHACKQKNIPIILANARLSARSAKKYTYVKNFSQQLLSCINIIAVQNNIDAQRFIKLGAKPQNVNIIGSIKFDVTLADNLFTQAEILKNTWGNQRLVWIAASTHAGEEEIILDVFAKLKLKIPHILLILVPRHPERFKNVEKLCKKNDITICRSKNEKCNHQTEIYLGDTMGELPLLYASSDIAFIGGSLVPVGGHNLLEPATLGIPSIIGEYSFNFAEIADNLITHNATIQIGSDKELLNILSKYLTNKKLRQQMGQNARLFIENNRGALNRLYKLISKLIN
jgi:3-deoxy-D-manno-octulosonic-acid transferase